MSEAVRDVTIRINLTPGDIGKMPEFDKWTVESEKFFNRTATGMKTLSTELADVRTATSSVIDELAGLTEFEVRGDGFDSITSAAKGFSSATHGAMEYAERSVEDINRELETLSSTLDSIDVPEISIDSTAAASIAAIETAVEVLNGTLADTPSQALLANDSLNVIIDSANGVTGAASEMSQALGGIEIPELSVDSTAADGIEAIVTATEGITDAMHDAATATSTTAETAVESAKEVQTATEKEGKTAQQVMFDKIRLGERLAAFNRRAADEAAKQSKDTSEAAKKAGEESQRQLFAASGAIAQSLAAGGQFVSTLRLIGGESRQLEELARAFTEVQGIVQGIGAGVQGFNALNQGLASLQAASAAATVSLTATGGAATFTQTALIRLAPAAFAAQTALGPVAVAVAGIGLAVASVTAISNSFGKEVPEDADAATRAYERTNDQLARMKRMIDANAASTKAQNSLLQTELDLRNALDGKGHTPERIEEKRENAVKTATDDANERLIAEREAAKKDVAALEKERSDIEKRNKEILKDLPQPDSRMKSATRDAIKYTGPLGGYVANKVLGSEEQDPALVNEFKANKEKLSNLEEQLSQKRQAGEFADGMTLTPENLEEFTRSLEDIPDEVHGVFKDISADMARSVATAVGGEKQDLVGALNDNKMKLDENTRAQQELRDKFETERDVALRLQTDPDQRREIAQGINTAGATGNLNAGIDALSPVISSERQSELRGFLSEGTLTLQTLRKELDDAAEFASEAEKLKDDIAAANKERASIEQLGVELAAARARVDQQLKILIDETRDTRAAVEQR